MRIIMERMSRVGVPTDCNIMVRVLFPSATLDCASDVISHTCHPFVGVTNIVERVTSLEEHVGAVFQVTVSSAKASHACALTVKDEVPVTLCLYNPNKALVGVIAAGNGNSDKSNVRIIFDSPEPMPIFPNLVGRYRQVQN